MNKLLNRKAQSALEYAFLIVAIAAAFVIMATYVARAISGNVKGTADQISEKHFNPAQDTNITITRNSERTIENKSVRLYDEEQEACGWQSKTMEKIVKDETTRSGTE
jgi:uncharacterized protein (UPF0333 family)